MDMNGVLTRLREICLALPEAEAYVMHDHPAFRTGKKPFVIVGDKPYKGTPPSLAVKVSLFDQPLYLEDPRFFRTPYIGQHGWVSLRLEDELDWELINRIVLVSYRQTASKRLMNVLDA